MNAVCANCRQPTLPNAVFCHHCGTQVQKRCPGCNTPNPADSAFCHSCGAKLETPATQSAAAAQEAALAMPRAEAIAFCPRCQATNDFQSLFCYKCGLPLERVGGPVSGAATAVPGVLAGSPGERAVVRAGCWVRLAAFLLDLILVAMVGTAVFAAVGFDLGKKPITLADLTGFSRENLIVSVIWVAYLTVGWSVWGTTIGKRVFNLYVMRPNGSKMGAARALARALCYLLPLVLPIGFLMVAFGKDKRALHDLIVDSHVVTRKP